MKRRRDFNFSILAYLLLAALLCSCASAGKRFNHEKISELDLGKLTVAEATESYGKPQIVGTKTTSEGKFEVFRYRHAVAGFAAAEMRELVLEFKNGQLNAFLYGSSFDQDRTHVDLASANAIKVGATTKDEVLRVLGKPHGKARCPSMLNDFKDLCAKGSEIWAWAAWERANLYQRRTPIGSSRVYIAFDSAGKVADVQTAHVDSK